MNFRVARISWAICPQIASGCIDCRDYPCLVEGVVSHPQPIDPVSDEVRLGIDDGDGISVAESNRM